MKIKIIILNAGASLLATCTYGLIIFHVPSEKPRILWLFGIAVFFLFSFTFIQFLHKKFIKKLRPINLIRFKRRRFNEVLKELEEGLCYHKKKGDIPRIYTTNLGINQKAHIDQEKFKDFSDTLDKGIEKKQLINLCLFTLYDKQSSKKAIFLAEKFADNPCLKIQVTLQNNSLYTLPKYNLFIIEDYVSYLTFEDVQGESISIKSTSPKEIQSFVNLYNSISANVNFEVLKDENGINKNIVNQLKVKYQ